MSAAIGGAPSVSDEGKKLVDSESDRRSRLGAESAFPSPPPPMDQSRRRPPSAIDGTDFEDKKAASVINRRRFALEFPHPHLAPGGAARMGSSLHLRPPLPISFISSSTRLVLCPRRDLRGGGGGGVRTACAALDRSQPASFFGLRSDLGFRLPRKWNFSSLVIVF